MKPLFVLAALAVAFAPMAGQGVQVIANPSIGIDHLTAADLKDIFLGTKTAIGGTAVEPVLAQSGEAHQEFLKTYLGKSDSALRNHFKTLVFTGKGAQPKTFGSDAEIVKYVARTKGAIAYVAAAVDIGGAKKIEVR